MAQKVKLSIFESSKYVYDEHFRGNPRKNLHFFSRFKPGVHLYAISPHGQTAIMHHYIKLQIENLKSYWLT